MSLFASLFGKDTLIGLDIGSSMVKAVQVESQRNGFRVVRAAQQKLPVGAVRDGVVLSREAVSGAIRQMLEAAGIQATGATLAVSGPSVIVRQIRVPKMPEAVLQKSIRFEATKYISSNIDESALAFDILGTAEDDHTQMDVMLVAVPKELVESRVAASEMSQLEAFSVDTEAFAAQRAVVDLNRDEFADSSLRALVDMGAAHTEVIILSGPDFALTRSIPIAGDTFTDALKNHLRIEAAEAEERKKDIDMSALITGEGGPESIEVARVVQTTMDELLREIRRSINYFQSQLNENGEATPLEEILLIGGSAQIGGIAEYMVARLGIRTRVFDPFASPMVDAAPEAEEWLRQNGLGLGIALGLAIKEHQNRPLGGKR